MRCRVLPLLFSALLISAASACDGCAEEPVGIGDDDADKNGDGSLPVGPAEGEGEIEQPEGRVLVFEGTTPADVFYGSSTELRFFLKTQGGQPVRDQPVVFTQSGTGGALDVSSAPTTTAGLAIVRFVAASVTGTMTVTATADLAAPVSVTIRVKENPFGTLVVAASSTARIPVTRAESKIYAGPAATTPTCAQLATATVVPTATFLADFTTLPQSRTFTNVPTGSKVTVKATGFNIDGVKVAEKCIEGGPIAGGATTTIAASLVQLPSVLAGDYDVLMNVNVGDALPSPYDTYIDTTTAILSDPAGYAAYQAIVQVDLSTGSSFIVDWDVNDQPIQPTYQEVADNASVYGTWSIARDLLDDTLRAQLGQNYITMTTIGGDIRHAVTQFDVGARLHIVAGTAPNTLQIDERWNDIVFQWSYGCPEGDLGCARRAVILDDTDYAPVVTSYGAQYLHQPTTVAPITTERFGIQTDPHLFALKYGAVVLIAMNEIVFPNLPPAIAGNSLEEVLGNIVDCASVGASVADAIGFGNDSFYEGFCDLGIDFAAQSIEGYALSLSVGEGNPELAPKDQTGALGGGNFYVVDKDQDLNTELVRELTYQVQWNDPDNEGLSADLLAPITGEGRLTAAGCAVDATCDDGFACVPVPHYLKVKQVEMDCHRAKGTVAGEGDCTTNTQCASNICLGATTTVPGSCFASCTVDDDCLGTSICALNQLTLDLDQTLAGLGDQPVSACH